MPETGFQIENPMKPASIPLLERNASRNLGKSGKGGVAAPSRKSRRRHPKLAQTGWSASAMTANHHEVTSLASVSAGSLAAMVCARMS